MSEVSTDDLIDSTIKKEIDEKYDLYERRIEALE
jgi:hypothetical protein